MQENKSIDELVHVFVSPTRHQSGVVMPIQEHTNAVVHVTDGTESLQSCDGVVTQNREIILGVHTQDCAPICFFDQTKIGVAHVGWPGFTKNLIERMMTLFDPASLSVFVGPHLHVFEIQRDFCYDAITGYIGDEFLREEDGKLLFYFQKAIASKLPPSTVFDPRSTAHDMTLPSHRHKRKFGHIITTITF
jgi:copper oxidase (laccase) domain-containing protein